MGTEERAYKVVGYKIKINFKLEGHHIDCLVMRRAADLEGNREGSSDEGVQGGRRPQAALGTYIRVFLNSMMTQ